MNLLTHFGNYMVAEYETTEDLLMELEWLRNDDTDGVRRRSAAHVLSLTCAIHMHLMG